MSTLPYHQAKELIESKIKDYTAKSEGLQTPPITIEREGGKTELPPSEEYLNSLKVK